MTEHAQRRLFAVGALLMAGAALAWISMGSLGDNLVYYWSPTELIGKGERAVGATVLLGGLVSPGTVDWRPEDQFLSFQVTDGDISVPVECYGAPPQMFREGIGVVVEGSLGADGVFKTEHVMVKHSNEYKAPDEGERPEDIYRTLMVEES
jgi:cytochrome c-type biogenesis protein CcmE